MFSKHDKTAILEYENKETADVFVFQTNLVGVQLFPYVNCTLFFVPNICMAARHVSENVLKAIVIKMLHN